MACSRGGRLKVPRPRQQRRSAALSALATAALLGLLLWLRLPSDGRSAARRRSRPLEECSAAELFSNRVHALTGEEWWATSAGTAVLEQLRGSPAGDYRAPQETRASEKIENAITSLSFVMPWRDADVSVPPVHLNMTLGEYIERADYSLVVMHVLPAFIVLLGGWLLACGPHAVVWRRCPRLQPSARAHSELQRDVPKLGLRALFGCSCLLAVVMMWANGALSAVLLELPAAYADAVAALQTASAEADAVVVQLQLAAAGRAGNSSNSSSTTGSGDAGRYDHLGGGSCEASVVVASLQCYSAQMEAMAAGLNESWPTGVATRPRLLIRNATEEAEAEEDSGSEDGQAAVAADIDMVSVRGGGDSFLHQLAFGNSVRERATTVIVGLVPMLSWLAVICSTYERPGWLGLTSLLLSWGAAALIMGAALVLLCAMLLADLCAVADSKNRGGGMLTAVNFAVIHPGRVAFELQAMRLAEQAARADIACSALAGNASAAVVDGSVPTPFPLQCAAWLQGGEGRSGWSQDHDRGVRVAGLGGQWPAARHYIGCAKPNGSRTAGEDEESQALPSLPGGPQQHTWLADWLGRGDYDRGNSSSADEVVEDVAGCAAVGVPYTEALSPLPCRQGLPVLVAMWLTFIMAAVILCTTSCFAACTARSFNADQLWEDEVAEEVEKLLGGLEASSDGSSGSDDIDAFAPPRPRGSSSSQRGGPDFSFYLPALQKLLDVGRGSGSLAGGGS